jgi:hypothetical protein
MNLREMHGMIVDPNIHGIAGVCAVGWGIDRVTRRYSTAGSTLVRR